MSNDPPPEPTSSIVVSSGISKEFSSVKRTPETMSRREETFCDNVSINESLDTLNFPVDSSSAKETLETLIPFNTRTLSGSLRVISFVFSNLPPPNKVKVNAPTFGVAPLYFRVLSRNTLIPESARCVIFVMISAFSFTVNVPPLSASVPPDNVSAALNLSIPLRIS